MRRNGQMKEIEKEREGVLEEIQRQETVLFGLKQQVVVLDRLLANLSGVPLPDANEAESVDDTKRRQGIKKVVMEIIQDFGNNGFSPSDVVSQAKKRGRSVHVGSVRSLLSRLKGNDALEMREGKYFTPFRKADVMPLRAV